MISVIIPTTYRDTLDRAIRSVQAQTIDPATIQIIVQDGTHCRPAACRNAAIPYATGEWIVFLDDDDYWLPHHLAILSQYMDSSEVIIAAHTTMSISSEFRGLDSYLSRGSSFPTGCIAVKASVLRKAGGFNTALPHSESWDLLTRLAQYNYVISAEQTWVRTLHDLGTGQQHSHRDRMRDRLS